MHLFAEYLAHGLVFNQIPKNKRILSVTFYRYIDLIE